MRHGRSSTSATLASRYVTQVMSCGFDFGRDSIGSRRPGSARKSGPQSSSTRSTAQLLRRGIPMRRTTLPVLFAAIFAVSPWARADVVGVTGAANIDLLGHPARRRHADHPTRRERAPENEKIETSASGNVQVLFVDKTTLNIGPNSSLVIDRFVYDPKAGTGQVALSLGKGVLRVVGGFATHTGAHDRDPGRVNRPARRHRDHRVSRRRGRELSSATVISR